LKIVEILYRLYERLLWSQISHGPFPHHIGLILDGNRRFARSKGLSFDHGYEAGLTKLEDFLRWCEEIGLSIVTIYAFSLENFDRDPDEVSFLMQLFLRKLSEFRTNSKAVDSGLRIQVIGKRHLLSAELQKEIAVAERITSANTQLTLNIAIGYGGRAEIVDAVKTIARQVAEGALPIEDIDEKVLENCLYTRGMPDPDLIIRTSGEERLSGFLLWQSAYAELYFAQVNWPVFRKLDFWRALRSFQQRDRRFGR